MPDTQSAYLLKPWNVRAVRRGRKVYVGCVFEANEADARIAAEKFRIDPEHAMQQGHIGPSARALVGAEPFTVSTVY